MVYRTQHPELNWREDKLRSRRIRPMVESTCMGRRSKNWRGLARWISTMAREDFPETRRVELRCKAGPFPGTKGEQLSHFVEVEAPHWKPRMPK